VHSPLVRRSLIAFHLALGGGLLIGSVQTIVAAWPPAAGPASAHLALLAGVEALGAALFLIPRTLRVGAALLLLTLVVAFLAHGVRGHWRWDLVVYAAGTWFIAVHGPGWGERRT
jgi:hypothetical protein